MGVLDLLKGLFKGKKPADLIDEAQEKLQDGSLDDVLGKVGMSGTQLGSIAGGVMAVIELAKKAFNKAHNAEDGEEPEEEDDEEYEDSEDSDDSDEELEEGRTCAFKAESTLYTLDHE